MLQLEFGMVKFLWRFRMKDSFGNGGNNTNNNGLSEEQQQELNRLAKEKKAAEMAKETPEQKELRQLRERKETYDQLHQRFDDLKDHQSKASKLREKLELHKSKSASELKELSDRLADKIEERWEEESKVRMPLAELKDKSKQLNNKLEKLEKDEPWKNKLKDQLEQEKLEAKSEISKLEAQKFKPLSEARRLENQLEAKKEKTKLRTNELSGQLKEHQDKGRITESEYKKLVAGIVEAKLKPEETARLDFLVEKAEKQELEYLLYRENISPDLSRNLIEINQGKKDKKSTAYSDLYGRFKNMENSKSPAEKTFYEHIEKKGLVTTGVGEFKSKEDLYKTVQDIVKASSLTREEMERYFDLEDKVAEKEAKQKAEIVGKQEPDSKERGIGENLKASSLTASSSGKSSGGLVQSSGVTAEQSQGEVTGKQLRNNKIMQNIHTSIGQGIRRSSRTLSLNVSSSPGKSSGGLDKSDAGMAEQSQKQKRGSGFRTRMTSSPENKSEQAKQGVVEERAQKGVTAADMEAQTIAMLSTAQPKESDKTGKAAQPEQKTSNRRSSRKDKQSGNEQKSVNQSDIDKQKEYVMPEPAKKPKMPDLTASGKSYQPVGADDLNPITDEMKKIAKEALSELKSSKSVNRQQSSAYFERSSSGEERSSGERNGKGATSKGSAYFEKSLSGEEKSSAEDVTSQAANLPGRSTDGGRGGKGGGARGGR
jgi:hypothetical protein